MKSSAAASMLPFRQFERRFLNNRLAPSPVQSVSRCHEPMQPIGLLPFWTNVIVQSRGVPRHALAARLEGQLVRPAMKPARSSQRNKIHRRERRASYGPLGDISRRIALLRRNKAVTLVAKAL
jgi:hypothetical protein